MDRILAILIFSFFVVHNCYGFVLFGGLTEVMKYESALPCSSSKEQKTCSSKNGYMGLALDKASKAGLKISKIILTGKDDSTKTFVQSKKYGLCQVETLTVEKAGKIFFLCSSKAKTSDKKFKIEKIFTLNKSGDEDFELVDISANPSEVQL